MEIEQENILDYNTEHPNYKRWERGRQSAYKRAEVVKSIINTARSCRNMRILDLGSGEGGTSSLLSDSNIVISYDLSMVRLRRQKMSARNYPFINGTAESLPFRDSYFDLIILQDVIEHIENRQLLIKELSRVLNKSGIIYLSTPNKYSVLNIISDPHWGIPLLALFNRAEIRKYFLRFLRKKDFRRNDIAELLSMNELKKLFSEFKLFIKTKEIVQILLVSPEGLLWSNFHLFIYGMLKKTGLLFLIYRAANNRPGIINNFFSPTFYFILIKN